MSERLSVSEPVAATIAGAVKTVRIHESAMPSATSPNPQVWDGSGLGREIVALAEERLDDATILETPAAGHRQPVGVTFAEIVGHRVRFIRETLDPRGPVAVVVGQRGMGHRVAPGLGAMACHGVLTLAITRAFVADGAGVVGALTPRLYSQ